MVEPMELKEPTKSTEPAELKDPEYWSYTRIVTYIVGAGCTDATVNYIRPIITHHNAVCAVRADTDYSDPPIQGDYNSVAGLQTLYLTAFKEAIRAMSAADSVSGLSYSV